MFVWRTFLKQVTNVRNKFKVRWSFRVRQWSFVVRFYTHAKGVGCTSRHTVQYVNDRLWNDRIGLPRQLGFLAIIRVQEKWRTLMEEKKWIKSIYIFLTVVWLIFYKNNNFYIGHYTPHFFWKKWLVIMFFSLCILEHLKRSLWRTERPTMNRKG
jgi:hypothetical protein